jgi:hypothetical protein
MLQAVRFAFRVHQVLILLLYIVTFVKWFHFNSYFAPMN